MTKRPSEGEFGTALRLVDLSMIVYKPPDPKNSSGVSNWKPCDFMVWRQDRIDSDDTDDTIPWDIVSPVWFECKDTTQVNAFPFADLRPSQIAAIHDAAKIGMPYWLAVYWRRHRAWTISDAWRVLEWHREERARLPVRGVSSIPRELLMSRFGIETKPLLLTSTLKQVLLGEVG